VCVGDKESVLVCGRERKRECVWGGHRECSCVCERVCVCVGSKESALVCVREKESVCVCV